MPRYDLCGRSSCQRQGYPCGLQRPLRSPPCPPPLPPLPCPARCQGQTGPAGPQGPAGPAGKSAYEIAVEHGYVGTEEEWLESLKGEPKPFLSSYAEGTGNTQSVATGGLIVFDPDTAESIGNNITLDSTGTVFTITRPGLYHVEWTVNLSPGANNAVIGVLENGEIVSGASSTTDGNFSSGTLIEVDTVPFTLSLENYGGPIALENTGSAASIRIVRFADGPSV